MFLFIVIQIIIIALLNFEEGFSNIFWLFLFTLVFWFLVSGIVTKWLAQPLVNFSLWAEGTNLEALIDGASIPLVSGELVTSMGKNQCILFQESFRTPPKSLLDILDRAFFPTALIIGVEALYLAVLEFTGLIYHLPWILHIFNFLFLHLLSPALMSIIVLPIWIVNDTRARIFHAQTHELRRIGNSLKDALNTAAGFGALYRFATLLFGNLIVFLYAVVTFLMVPLPIFFTTLVYLWQFHNKRVIKIESVFEEALTPV
jgi:hypothetical protein